MKKYMKFIILMLALIFCDVFLITHRSDIKSLETDHNLGYFEYERNRSGYTVNTASLKIRRNSGKTHCRGVAMLSSKLLTEEY